MELSIIILTYKVPHYLNLCLSSVKDSIIDLDAEVIVVNNAQDKETSNLVKLKYPEFTYIQNSKNIGFSAGNNVGVKRAKGNYICLLNPDTVVGNNTFKNILAKAKQLPDLGCIGPYLMNGTGHFLPESKRNTPTPKVALLKLLGNNQSYYPTQIQAKDFSKVDILVGAFMLMKKNRYWEVGGLDEAYFMYGEDIDLSYAFLQNNYQNYYLGTEKVIHFKGESTIKDQVYVNRFYNAMLIFYEKNFSHFKLLSWLARLSMTFIKLYAVLMVKKQSEKGPRQINHLVYVNCETDLQNAAIFDANKKPEIYQMSVQEALSFSKKETLFILDANQLTYKEIIDLIFEIHGQGIHFRIRPRNSKYVIGSDSSYLQGEVLKF
ncbi:MAG: glycosyltransferase family 2 protein [Flavobacteriaceae bacterium]|nr:glycosyltransferase family 2 protein [Flavobacteriaceae bacterium]